MAKATMTLSSGTIVALEGTPEELDEILKRIEKAPSVEVKKSAGEPPKKREKKSAKDHILDLREDGFFDRPKDLTEIKQGLEVVGQFMTPSTLSARMVEIVGARELRRLNEEGKWKYVRS